MTWRPWIRRRSDADIDEEIASHLQMAIRDRIDQGEPLREARRRALLEFGSPTLAKEQTRAIWAWTHLEQLFADFHIGARILWRAPALSATAVLLIAFVIGGNTTIFSIVHGVLTKPAPGIVADGLVSVGWISEQGTIHPGGSYANYRDIAAHAQTLRPMMAAEFARMAVATRDGSYAVQGDLVTPGYFDTLGIQPLAGRFFTDDDDRTAAAGLVAVISERFWTAHLSGSPGAIGQAVTVDSHTATIVGVVPAPFSGTMLGETADVWLPLVAYSRLEGNDATLTDRWAPNVLMMGRLAPGVSFRAARAELDTISRGLARVYGQPGKTSTIHLVPYSGTAAGDSLIAQRGPWFLAMFSIITVLTLLVVCANVANLMLGRAVVRAREMAVRQSFGASRARIVRIFVAEGLAVSLAAWGAATVAAFWLTRALPRIIPPLDGSTSQVHFDFTPDWRVLGYAMLLALAGTCLVSAAPAMRACREDLAPSLKAGEHGVVHGRSTVSSGLVVMQLAFAVLLVTAAGLAFRSLTMLRASDLGFSPANLLLVTVNTKAVAATPEEQTALLGSMSARLRGVPGVTAASYARRPTQSFWPPERIAPRDGGSPIVAERNEVGPGYFGALGIAPLLGRDFDERDAAEAAPTAIVNETLAARLWPGDTAIGRTLPLKGTPSPAIIVGVVPDAFYNGFRRQPHPAFVFVAAGHAPQETGDLTLYVRYRGSVAQVAPAVASTLRNVSDRAPIVRSKTMEMQLAETTWPVRALTALLAIFALGSLVIAAIGQYAAVAFTMRRRIRDFGVRMALGATPERILASVVREGFRLTAAGLLFGLALSLVVGRALRSMLYGVTPTDARTYLAVSALLAVASLVACVLPAYRASRIDPMEALRQE